MTTLQQRDTSTARPDHVFVNRRHDPGRYRTVDRNSNPDHHLALDPDDAPGNRPQNSYCTKGTP